MRQEAQLATAVARSATYVLVATVAAAAVAVEAVTDVEVAAKAVHDPMGVEVTVEQSTLVEGEVTADRARIEAWKQWIDLGAE